jgi:ubiquinone/menaquinone biosynthesis C-methylase UbiE
MNESLLDPRCSTKLYSLSDTEIKTHLRRYFQSDYPGELSVSEYEMLKCSQSGVVFAHPMIGGDETFYSWIGSFSEYFPGHRWEYFQVIEALKTRQEQQAAPIKILDIGCGDGKFLKKIANEVPECELYGLEISQESLSKVKDDRIRLIHGDTSKIEKMDIVFDVITAFHIIEHISDPVGFLNSIKRAMGPETVVYVSNPLSPMHFESHFFDILNHPPHHLTRWNPESMIAVTARLGFEPEIVLPKAAPLSERIKTTFRMRFYWRQSPRIRNMIVKMFAHLPECLSIIWAQSVRKRHEGTLPDLMLTKLRLSRSTAEN